MTFSDETEENHESSAPDREIVLEDNQVLPEGSVCSQGTDI